MSDDAKMEVERLHYERLLVALAQAQQENARLRAEVDRPRAAVGYDAPEKAEAAQRERDARVLEERAVAEDATARYCFEHNDGVGGARAMCRAEAMRDDAAAIRAQGEG